MSSSFWSFLRVDLLILFRTRLHLWGVGSALVLGILIRMLKQHGTIQISIAATLGLLVGLSAILFGGLLVGRAVEQGSLGALSTTPAQTKCFLASKASSLCAVGFVQAVLVLITSGAQGPHDLLLFTLGITGVAAIGGLLGMWMGTYTWPRRTALVAGMLTLFEVLSSTSTGFHAWTREWLPVPPFASVALIEGSLLNITTPTLALAFGGSCLMIAGLFALCLRRVKSISCWGTRG